MAGTNESTWIGPVNSAPFQAADAQMVLQDIQDGVFKNAIYRAINVSFRDTEGRVGRRDYATHLIHWYPAKMFHRIPSIFLDTIPLEHGAYILDPFCGSGTVLLEASMRGHEAVGIDINPLAQLISRTKVTPIAPDALHETLLLILPRAKRLRSKPNSDTVLDSWLSQPARNGLHRLGTAIKEIADCDIRSFFLVTLTSIVRRVSLADPAIPPLVRLRRERAESAGARYRHALEKSQDITTSSVYGAFLEAAMKNIRRMAELHALEPDLGRAHFPTSEAHAAETGLPSGSIDAIITSPPYCGAQKYVRSLKLELLVSGFPKGNLRQLDRSTLGSEAITTCLSPLDALLTGDRYVDGAVRQIYEGNPVRARMASDYSKYLRRFAIECGRILAPDGHLLVTLGRSTLAGVPFHADQVLSDAAEAAGLQRVATLVDRIPSRGLLTQRHRTSGRIDQEFIVWLRKPATVAGSSLRSPR